jgi:hypothetical protein
MHLLCISPPFRRLSSPISTSSRSSGRPRSVTIYAGDNKKQPNYIDIGVASRGGWDEVKIVRTTTPEPLLDSKKHKPASRKPAQAPRTPVVIQPPLTYNPSSLEFEGGLEESLGFRFFGIVVRGFRTCRSESPSFNNGKVM